MASSTAALGVTTSLQAPLLGLSLELEECQNVNKEGPQPRKLSPKIDAVPLVNTSPSTDVFQLPDFTIKDIRRVIPPECYERSAMRGLGYIARDIILLSSTFWLFHHFVVPENVPSTIARGFLWSVYGFVNGLFGTGLWVMGHECGHQSLSPSKVLNDTVGLIVHSSLLVPYFSWKISHGKHHKATGHMERDMVFVPRTRSEFAKRVGIATENLSDVVEEAPLFSFFMLFARQLLGWPLYLLSNRTGHNYHDRQPEGRGKNKTNALGGGVNHFSPSSPLYEAKDAKWIIVSDVGILVMLGALYSIGSTFGWSNLAVWYFLPYLWVNHWLVAITYLQHTDPTLPHYDAQSWTYVRGAAATIDRDLGFVGRHLFHGIAETHVLHHYISAIPFYNAQKASEAIIPVMGSHYRANTAGGPVGFVKALYTNARECQWVEPMEGAGEDLQHVLFFKNKNGIDIRPATLRA